MDIHHRIRIIQRHDKSDTHEILVEGIDEGSPVSCHVEGITEGMGDGSLLHASLGNPYQLLDAQCPDLVIGIGSQAEGSDQLLRQIAARTLAEHGDASLDIHTGGKCLPRFPRLGQSLVGDPCALDRIALHDQFRRGEFGINLDPHRLALLGHPSRDFSQRGQVTARVAHLAGANRCRNGDLSAAGQIVYIIIRHGSKEWQFLLLEFREQLLECHRIHDGTREHMAANFLALVDDQHHRLLDRFQPVSCRLGVMLADALHQCIGRAQVGNASPDVEDIKVHGFTIVCRHSASLLFRFYCVYSSPRGHPCQPLPVTPFQGATTAGNACFCQAVS